MYKQPTLKPNQNRNIISKTDYLTRFFDRFNHSQFFYWSSILVMCLTVLMNSQTRPTYDEAIERAYERAALKYFITSGQDTSFLNAKSEGWGQSFPEIRYYGASFELVCALYNQFITSHHEFLFRHVLNTILGFLSFFFIALIVRKLNGNLAGALTMFIFLLSPTYLGYSAMESKNIPLSLGYSITVYSLYLLINNFPIIRWKTILLLISGIALAVSLRVAGVITAGFVGVFALIWTILNIKKYKISTHILFLSILSIASFLGILLGLSTYPNFWHSGMNHVFDSIGLVKNFKPIYLLFEGKEVFNTTAPWYYILKIFYLTVPVFVLLGFVWYILLSLFQKDKKLIHLILFIVTVLPVTILIIQKASLYNGWRHISFIYPSFCALAVLGWFYIGQFLKKYLVLKHIPHILFLIYFLGTGIWMISNFRYNYSYYNFLAGNYKMNISGRYEIEYYSTATLVCYDYLWNKKLKNENKPITIMTNNPIMIEYAKDNNHFKPNLHIKYQPFANFAQSKWDYAILSPRLISKPILDLFYPPKGTIFKQSISRVPVAALVKRENFNDSIGINYLFKNQAEPAKRNLELAFEYNKKNYQVWYFLSIAYFLSGDYNKSIQFMESYLALKQEPKGYFYIAASYYSNNQHDKAIPYWKRTIDLTNNNKELSDYYYYMANSYLQLKDNNQAIKNLKISIEKNTSNQAAKNLLNQIN